MQLRPGILFAAIGMASLFSTSAQAQDKRLTFDVAAIHRSQATDLNGFIKALPEGHGYTAQNIPVKLMISLMYKLPMRQIQGAPDWLESDRYDVEARADGSYSLDILHTMYQNLLADRFNLKFHMETKQGSVYLLTVDTSGSKMKVNDGPQDFNIPITYGPQGAVGVRVPMNYLSWWLGQTLQSDGRPVVDRTGLTDNYNFTLSYAPIQPPGSERPDPQNRPSIFDAVRQQLGLRLQPGQGPVEYLVIDHIERPSAN